MLVINQLKASHQPAYSQVHQIYFFPNSNYNLATYWYMGALSDDKSGAPDSSTLCGVCHPLSKQWRHGWPCDREDHPPVHAEHCIAIVHEVHIHFFNILVLHHAEGEEIHTWKGRYLSAFILTYCTLRTGRYTVWLHIFLFISYMACRLFLAFICRTVPLSALSSYFKLNKFLSVCTVYP